MSYTNETKTGTFGEFRVIKDSERPIDGYGSYCPVRNNVASHATITVQDSNGNVVGAYTRTAYYREPANTSQTQATLTIAGQSFTLKEMHNERQQAEHRRNTEPSEGYKLVAEDGTTINAPDISRYENKRAAFKRNIEAIHGVKVGR